jgi:uncharacterized membrane protein
MESRAQILGHPVHQIAVMFPIGALGFSVTSDLLHTTTGRREFADAARLALDFGLASAAFAVPFGVVDWLAIESPSRAKKVGLWHAIGNATVLALFGTARLLRSRGKTTAKAKAYSAAGLGLACVTAWLGTELINRHGIGVHDLIGEDVPSSLSDWGSSIRRARLSERDPELVPAER